MVREGYKGITIDENTYSLIEEIRKEKNCKTIPETIRLLIRSFK